MWALAVDLGDLALTEGEPDHRCIHVVEPDDGVNVGHVGSSSGLPVVSFDDAPTIGRGIEDKGSAGTSVDHSREPTSRSGRWTLSRGAQH